MSRYIDAAVMQDKLRELCNKYTVAYGSRYGSFGKDISEITDKVPTADVQEVRHGKWTDKGSLSCRCAECGCKSNRESNFCPNCSAKMDKEESE